MGLARIIVLAVAIATVTHAAEVRHMEMMESLGSPPANEMCIPNKNCIPPDCRCWADRTIPGNLTSDRTPQIVLLTFGNSINSATKRNSLDLLREITNPNGCPALGTFFIESSNTDAFVVKDLYEDGHEVALSTMNDTIPRTPKEWMDNIKRVKEKLLMAGIPDHSIQGFRSAQLYAGGDDALSAISQLKLQYDSTCVNRQYVDRGNTLWPYTYDFPYNDPYCSIGKTPNKKHKGAWQFLMPVLKYKFKFCSTVSGCAQYLHKNSSDDVYNFLFQNFVRHYLGNKSPLNLYLDPLWLTYSHQRDGTRQFLQFLDALPDVWLINFQQALAWMKTPVDRTMALKYPPWSCAQSRAEKVEEDIPLPQPQPQPRQPFQESNDFSHMVVPNYSLT